MRKREQKKSVDSINREEERNFARKRDTVGMKEIRKERGIERVEEVLYFGTWQD